MAEEKTYGEKRQIVLRYKRRRKKHKRIMLYILLGIAIVIVLMPPSVKGNQNIMNGIFVLTAIYALFVNAYNRELRRCPFCGEVFSEFWKYVPLDCPHCNESLDYE